MMKKIRKIKVETNCSFCKRTEKMGFKEVVTLSKYLSERGRILSKDKTGVCAKHQRQLAIEVKRARHLALLPYVSSL